MFDKHVDGSLPVSSRLFARRLHDLLRTALRAGSFSSGRLPSEAELMAQYRASRDVVREALDLLRHDGLIERRRGLGTMSIRSDYVVALAPPPEGHSLEDHVALGRVSSHLLHRTWLPAPTVIADRLDGVETNDDCLCVECVMLLDDRPAAVLTNYLRAPEASRIDQTTFRDDYYSLLRAGGIDVVACDIGLQAACADQCVAALLQVLPGEPVLLLEQTIRNNNGEAINYALGTCRSEFQLEVSQIPRVDLTGTITR
ncbi:GntR family transcriptional regulator [Nocardia brasiliensis]